MKIRNNLKFIIMIVILVILVVGVLALVVMDERTAQRRDIEKFLRTRLAEEAERARREQAQAESDMTLDEARKGLPDVDKIDYNIDDK